MTGEVIKSFLVGLGFEVEEGSLEKFNKALAGAALKVTALYVSIQAATAGIFKGIADIAEGFEKFGYEAHIIAPEINKTLELRRSMLEAYRIAGINIKQVVQESVRFNLSLAKTKFALDAIYKSVGARFLPLLTKQMNIFRTQIYANMPKIQHALEKFIGFLFKAFQATIVLGARVWSILGRVWDFFAKLDEATDGWSTKVLGAIAIWKLLNLTFLTTPLGMILTGLVAILALFDDFKTWQEGGESFFDWSSALPIIDAVKASVNSLVEAWRGLVDIVLNVVLAFQQLFSGDYQGFFDSLKDFGRSTIAIFSKLWDILSSLLGISSSISKIVPSFLGGGGASQGAAAVGGGALGAVASGIGSFFGNQNAGANLSQATSPVAPLGATNQNNSTNQQVSQETNINIQGTSDANATAKAVSSEQNKVNFDLARNLRGATR